jgi:hypothetical protein
MTYRVIQWATGAKGMYALREVIRHPDLELVGLRVYGPAKVGQDAGVIAGVEPTGIIATDRIEDILAVDADCVLYMAQMKLPFEQHDENVCKLLESGKNVIALTGYYWPLTHGRDYVERLEAACQKGKSTLFGTGFSPGFMTERMALQLTEASMNVESIHYVEICDCSHNKGTQIFDMMGCGKPPQETAIDSLTTQITTYYHYEVLDAMAAALGVMLDEKRTELETLIALQDEVTPSGILIREGTVGATVRKWVGYRNGKPFITSEHRWMVVGHIPGYPLDNLWEITVEGRPALQMQIRLGQTFADKMPDEVSIYPTFEAIAAPLIRAIPLVCKAPPGIMQAPTFAPWTSRIA